MEIFTNSQIDTKSLPRFEQVDFISLEPKYWRVVLIRLCITFIVFIGIGLSLIAIEPEIRAYAIPFFSGLLAAFAIIIGLNRLSFLRKAYAFREHDVLFRSGVIATTTIIIPYNRIQHVSLHEGFINRKFALGEVQIFTAGGSGSDIEIPGIAIEQAENIKQLLMGKIKKQLE